ncbi:MAG: CsbD family protein [Steroidobacteraceae bacterium]
MNKDTAQGNFTQLKGKIKQKWGQLTDDEIDEMEGNAQILAGKLQERYGMARDDAEREAREFKDQNNWQ